MMNDFNKKKRRVLYLFYTQKTFAAPLRRLDLANHLP